MPIKYLILFVWIWIQFPPVVGIAQSTSGIYVLHKDGVDFYVNVKGDRFAMFALQENPKPGSKASFVLSDYGSGQYEESANEVSFSFKNIAENWLNSKDSLNVSMSTDTLQSGIRLNVSLNFMASNMGNNYLDIRSSAGIQSHSFDKGDKVSLTIPDSIFVNEINLSLMGYGKRKLPYSRMYNVFSYAYVVNDEALQVHIFKDLVWNFKIRSNKNLYRFDNNEYMAKADDKIIDFLLTMKQTNSNAGKILSSWL
ncbi:hypothetical protein ABDK00_014405 [Niabella insulamsoli]|uniref:hypothetical protein n=1 Tax=Niabella insulamsoli TaxID=3144874 RepID=UPI0031FD4339